MAINGCIMRIFLIILLYLAGISWFIFTTDIFLDYNKLWMELKISSEIYISQIIYYIGKNILSLIAFIIAYKLSDK